MRLFNAHFSNHKTPHMKKLTEKDLVIGGKYVPHSKSVWGTIKESMELQKAKEIGQPYLFYLGKSDLSGSHTFGICLDKGGDFFLPSDVTPYVEEANLSVKLTTTQVTALESKIYNTLIQNPDMDMDNMAECEEAATNLVAEWLTENNIQVIAED